MVRLVPLGKIRQIYGVTARSTAVTFDNFMHEYLGMLACMHAYSHLIFGQMHAIDTRDPE